LLHIIFEMTYKICSWDVGIKNLAYCVIHKTNDVYEIKGWDIINLIEDDNKTCGCNTKKGKLCGKRARFCGSVNNTIKYYCGRHKNKHQPYKEGWKEELMTLIEKNANQKCSYLLPKKQQRCNKKAHYVSNMKYYCNAHNKIIIKKMEKESELKKIKRKKCTSKGMKLLAETMYIKLDKIKELLDVDEALIENQPTMKNPSMKTISSLLFGYFIMRGRVDRDNKINVRWISPSNKLKVNEDKTLEVMKNVKNDNEKYKMTKKMAIEYTKILLKDNKKWLDHLEKYKKKDDLADAMLQGYYYLSKRIVP